MNPTTSDSPYAVDVQDVHKRFKSVQAVAGVSLSIRPGEFIAVLGPNGAGKTTLVSMIEGIHAPDSGSITIFGKKWKKREKELRSLLGVALQETRFFDRATVFETLDLFASFYHHDGPRISEIIRLIDLEDKKNTYTMNLSHGQRQKLALGIALIHKPPLLILDEPTTGLDPRSRRELWEILLDLKKQGSTLVLTTHYMEEAEYLCDRIYILDHGRIIARGTLDELLQAQGMAEWISFAVDSPIREARLNDLPGFLAVDWQIPGKRGCLKVQRILSTLPALQEMTANAGVTLTELECRRMDLDDLFTSLTGRTLNE